jgi:hypothetical protein
MSSREAWLRMKLEINSQSDVPIYVQLRENELLRIRYALPRVVSCKT